MFSEYLREKRESAGLSQQALADKMTSLGYKVSNGLISYYETNYSQKKEWTGRPKEKFLEYLAKVLNLSLEEVRAKAGYASDSDGLVIVGFGDELDPDDVAKIKSYIAFLKSQKK